MEPTNINNGHNPFCVFRAPDTLSTLEVSSQAFRPEQQEQEQWCVDYGGKGGRGRREVVATGVSAVWPLSWDQLLHPPDKPYECDEKNDGIVVGESMGMRKEDGEDDDSDSGNNDGCDDDYDEEFGENGDYARVEAVAAAAAATGGEDTSHAGISSSNSSNSSETRHQQQRCQGRSTGRRQWRRGAPRPLPCPPLALQSVFLLMTRVEGDKCALGGLSFLRAWYPNLQTLVPFIMEPKAPLPFLSSFSSESLDLPLSPSLIPETTQNSSPSQQDEAVAGGYGAGGSVLDAPVGDQVDAESFLLGPLAHAGVMLSVKPSVTRQHRQSAPPTSSTSAPSASRQASAPSFFAPLGPPSYEPKGDVALPFVDALLLPLLEAYARSMTTVSLGADAEQDNSADDHDNDRHRHHTQLHLAFDLAQNFAASATQVLVPQKK